MEMTVEDLKKRIKDAGLRITPQRLAVLDAVDRNNHPAADRVVKEIRKNHPNVATGTVYKILDTFVSRGIIRKIETRSGVMRYDTILQKHLHLTDGNSDRIEDYFDDELFELIQKYLQHKKIPGFQTADIKIKLTGKFTD